MTVKHRLPTLFTLELYEELLLEVSGIFHGDHLEADEGVVDQMSSTDLQLHV